MMSLQSFILCGILALATSQDYGYGPVEGQCDKTADDAIMGLCLAQFIDFGKR